VGIVFCRAGATTTSYFTDTLLPARHLAPMTQEDRPDRAFLEPGRRDCFELAAGPDSVEKFPDPVGVYMRPPVAGGNTMRP
jgi:hypothetical protein